MFQPDPAPGSESPANGGARKLDVPSPPAESVSEAGLRAGARLAAARQAKGLTLEQVATALKLPRDFIAALEAMNVKLLPGKAFARAYLKSYAALLGLNPAQIIAQFEAENALTREDAQPQIRNPVSKPSRERPWMAAAAIFVVLAGFIGWRAVSGVRDNPRLSEPAAQAGASADLAAPSPGAGAVGPDLAQVTLELRALAPAWLEVRGPEGTVFLSQTLEPGQRYRPDVGAGWTVHAADGGAFEILVAGQLFGPLGKPGAPVLGRQVDDIVRDATTTAAREAARAEVGG